MKALARYISALLLVVLPTAVGAAQGDYLRVSHVEGEVQIRIPEGSDWGPAVVNGPLSEGDQIWVPKGGKAELQLSGGALVRLDGNSGMQVLSIGSSASQFHLAQGSAYVYAETSQRETIQIDTPDGTVRAQTNAVYRVDLTDRSTDIAVYKGFVEAENRRGPVRVSAGKMLSVGMETAGMPEPLGPPDAWERWNMARNNYFRGGGSSARYLPDELKGYASDFDSSGRWVTIPEYGTVWTPTVIVTAQWAPYRHGRWIWRHGHAIWLPYDQWGWVPYHYGRWTYLSRYGWCWVPPAHRQVYWGPGYVGWVRNSSHIGWVPLAPREIYYGRGNYGPYSVNITSVSVQQTNAFNVYRNVTIVNGASVVPSSQLLSPASAVRGYSQTVHQGLFGRGNAIIGGPAVASVQASTRWSDRRIAPENRPPQALQNFSVNAAKQQRIPGREPERAVSRRGEPVRNHPAANVSGSSLAGRSSDPVRRSDTQLPPGGVGGSQRRPADSVLAGTTDLVSGRRKMSDRTVAPVPAVERRQVQTPVPVRQDTLSGASGAAQQPRQPQSGDRIGQRPDRVTSPAEVRGKDVPRSFAAPEKRQQPAAPATLQQPVQRDRVPAVHKESATVAAGRGSIEFAKPRQQVQPPQRTEQGRVHKVQDPQSVRPQSRQEHAAIRPQPVRVNEPKKEPSVKEQRKDRKDAHEGKGNKERGS